MPDLSWFKNTVLFSFLVVFACQAQEKSSNGKPLKTGAEQIESYWPVLQGQRIAVVANQTSVITNQKQNFTHLIDSLLTLNIDVKKVFAPEHGFRGKADAGEQVNDSFDAKTGLPIISLYGQHKKPTPEDLKDIDLVVFDIQDVGVRFYTYISTLHYVMEACAELNIPLLVLDRPNPNRHYVDGPVLEEFHQSFVGMHPVPVVYGMSIGEYAQMINGEGWLAQSITCDLSIIKLKHYDPEHLYELPIKPSPNLPNAKAVNLYPSLCFFEGTDVNAGRGTDLPFQVFGSPFLDPDYFDYSYTPQSNEGAKFPKHKGKLCFGKLLTDTATLSSINLSWLIEAYQHTENKGQFFNPFFTKLAGTQVLQQQIEQGLPEEDIKATWQNDLEVFKRVRSKYLLY